MRLLATPQVTPRWRHRSTSARSLSSSQALKKSAWPVSKEPDASDSSWPSPVIGQVMVNSSWGTGTGWLSGQAPSSLRAMWDTWSSLSRFSPSQQSGKLTASRSGRPSGHVGGVGDRSEPVPHDQATTSSGCGSSATWSPPIIFRPNG